jgi:prepilin peptidase CpaA
LAMSKPGLGSQSADDEVAASPRGPGKTIANAIVMGAPLLAAQRFPVYPMLSLWILALTAATLFWVALTDLREFKVRNEFVAILAGLYLLHAVCSGAWVSMQWNFAFAFLMLLGGAYAYSLQQIGGGDLKLLAVAFLWTGPWYAAPFVVLLLIFTGAYYVAARYGFAAARQTAAGLRIPLAPPLAGALIGALALNLVAPNS